MQEEAAEEKDSWEFKKCKEAPRRKTKNLAKSGLAPT